MNSKILLLLIGLIQLSLSDNPNGGGFGTADFNSVFSIGTFVNDCFNMTGWVITENGTIWMHLELSAKSWVGIGWHSPGSSDTGMYKADFVVATFDSNGKVFIHREFSNPEGYSARLLCR